MVTSKTNRRTQLIIHSAVKIFQSFKVIPITQNTNRASVRLRHIRPVSGTRVLIGLLVPVYAFQLHFVKPIVKACK